MKDMEGIIDRFEGNYAVVEFANRQMKEIPKNLLPGNAKEGDVIRLVNQQYLIDEKATLKHKEEIKRLSEGMFR